MATEHLETCIKVLAKDLEAVDRKTSTNSKLVEGYDAIFDLIHQHWELTTDKEEIIWREGYEQCMQDICDAIADEWGIELPLDPPRKGRL